MSEYQFDKNESQENQDKNKSNQTKSYRIPLRDLSQEKIIRIFDSINDEGRNIIIPIGFPKAGKSLFLSSLMYYCEKDTNKLWDGDYMLEYPYDKGEMSRDQMVTYFDDQKAYPATTSGTIDIIGLDVNPKKNLKPIKLAFVDLAGEDIEKLSPNNVGEFDDKIEGVLRGCETGSPIFCLITPFGPEKGDVAEDALHSKFMNYVKMKLPNLYDVSKFIIIVTQWDKIPKSMKVDVEDYIKTKRPKLSTLISAKGAKIIYGEYSVGKLENTKDDEGKNVVLIRKIDYGYPHNFWNNLYTLVTGKSFENKGWFSQLIKKIIG